VDRPDQTSSGGGPRGTQLAAGRALAVIVVAVVLGVLVLHAGGGPSGSAASTASTTSAVSTTTLAPRTTTSTTASHAGVKVLVANDSTTGGVAGGYSTALQRAGWTVLAPVTAKPPVRATSAAYYAANKRPQADQVAAAFGLPSSDVLPLSAATPVTSVAGADVVLVIGLDLAAKTPPTTVPPTTTTTTVPKTTTTKAHKSSNAA
jgi:hypothetical protein